MARRIRRGRILHLLARSGGWRGRRRAATVLTRAHTGRRISGCSRGGSCSGSNADRDTSIDDQRGLERRHRLNKEKSRTR